MKKSPFLARMRSSGGGGELPTRVTEVCYWNYVLCMVLTEVNAVKTMHLVKCIYIILMIYNLTETVTLPTVL